MADEQLSLKWNDFEEVVRASFGDLRSDNDFTDVTLACEDQCIKAHRVILSGCSPFFKRLLKNYSSHPQTLIFMRGLKFSDLVAMVDFIYEGEAKIFQEDLERFLSLAGELELKGLSGSESKGDSPKYKSESSNHQNPSRTSFGKKQMKEEDEKVNFEGDTNAIQRAIVPTHQNESKSSLIGSDTMRTINSLIEKRFDRHACLKCDYISTDKTNMKKHVERHIEGLAFPCNFCQKVFGSSQSFRNHKSGGRCQNLK